MSVANSPIVWSKYDPTGQYLCHVTIALDKHRVAVESVHHNGSGASFILDDSSLKVTSLQWAVLQDVTCVLLGLNNGEIWIYGIASNQVINKLSTTNNNEIRDMAISNEFVWCIDSRSFIYQFNLQTGKLLQHFQVDNCTDLSKLSTTHTDSQLLVASHSVFLIDTVSHGIIKQFPGHITTISNLVLIGKEFFFTTASNDRFLNIYDIVNGSNTMVLVASSNILHVSISEQDVIAAATEAGDVELFIDPLVSPHSSNKKRGNNKSKRCSKTIQLITSADDKLPVADVFVSRDILNITFLQNSVNFHFKDIQWQQDLTTTTQKFIIDSAQILKSKNVSAHHLLHGKDVAAVTHYAEGNATITSGDNFKHVEDVIRELEMHEQTNVLEESLADKLESNALQHIIKSKGSKNATAHTTKSAATAGTVITILQQALQSNDHSLLETVLNNRDERVIRDTIFRMNPPLVVLLLERLAERIARQTHRQGALNVWVKWCLIIHGGYLVTVPNLMTTLSSLHSTLKRRSDLLPRLLALETKLDSVLNALTLNTENILSEEEEEEEELTLVQEDADAEGVEYDEELDDAGLIDNDESGSEIDEYSEDEEKPLKKQDPVVPTQDQEDEDGGFSDVEMS